MKYKILYVHVTNSPFMPGHIIDLLAADHKTGYMEEGGRLGQPSVMNNVVLELSETEMGEIKEGLHCINLKEKKLERRVDVHNRMKFLHTQESELVDGYLTSEAQTEIDSLKIIEKEVRIASRMQRIA